MGEYIIDVYPELGPWRLFGGWMWRVRFDGERGCHVIADGQARSAEKASRRAEEAVERHHRRVSDARQKSRTWRVSPDDLDAEASDG